MDEDYYDEGSDIDNWEDEQVFQDHEGEEDDGWLIDYPIHEDSSFLDLSRGCD
jgi:hypothetical protein